MISSRNKKTNVSNISREFCFFYHSHHDKQLKVDDDEGRESKITVGQKHVLAKKQKQNKKKKKK